MCKRNKIHKGIFWSLLDRFGSQGVAFIITIVLARILTPEDYGLIAIVVIFISVSETFITSGLPSSLIQKENANDTDFSTVFYFSILLGLTAYLILFFLSSYISIYFNEDKIKIILQVMSLKVFISSLGVVHKTYMIKTLNFKPIFYAKIIGGVISGSVGIYLAIHGYGIWSLVVHYILGATIDIVVLWFSVSWRPSLSFSFYSLRELFMFGWRLLLASLLSSLYTNIYNLVIAKGYSSSQLAYYNQGRLFPQLIASNIVSAVSGVLFPAMARVQNQPDLLKTYLKNSISLSTFVIFPFMLGMVSVADTLVVSLLTEKWSDAVPFLQISCISFALLPIATSYNQLIKSVGKSEIFLKMEVVRKIIGIYILYLMFDYGVIAIAMAEVISVVLGIFVTIFYTRKIIDYGLFELSGDCTRSLLISTIMAVLVYSVGDLFLHKTFLVLVLQILVGFFFYIFISYFFNRTLMDDFFTNSLKIKSK